MPRLSSLASGVRTLAANRHRGALIKAARGSARGDLGDGGDRDLRAHLEATYRWLCRAQDHGDDDGVSGSFDMLAGHWRPSYPETTGYLIPTFLAFAEARSDPDARARALRMADWESEVQMADGAVVSGMVGESSLPAVFNTGQVLFGWLAALEATGAARYEQSARAAAEWLLENQDEDGAWRRNLSGMTRGSSPAYNCRCAWALAYAGATLDEERFTLAARRNCDWVLTEQNDAGWFAHNGFSDTEVPLLHTISYVLEGLVGVYAFVPEARYLDAAKRALAPIISAYEAGRIAGRFDGDWQGTVSWRCATGDAQIAAVLHRLDAHCPGEGYGATAGRLVHDVAAMQMRLSGTMKGSSPVIGGVPGSFPVWGGYMRFQLPNWAAKFYLDALLLHELGVDEKSFPGLPVAARGAA